MMYIYIYISLKSWPYIYAYVYTYMFMVDLPISQHSSMTIGKDIDDYKCIHNIVKVGGISKMINSFSLKLWDCCIAERKGLLYLV